MKFLNYIVHRKDQDDMVGNTIIAVHRCMPNSTTRVMAVTTKEMRFVKRHTQLIRSGKEPR